MTLELKGSRGSTRGRRDGNGRLRTIGVRTRGRAALRGMGLALVLLVIAALAAPVAATTGPQPRPQASTTVAETRSWAVHGVGRTLLRDDFTRDWQVFNRYARISSGRLLIDGGYLPDRPDTSRRDGWVLTHLGDRRWTDYVYDVKYDNANVGGYPSDVNVAIFHFRIASTSGEINGAGATNYTVSVGTSGVGLSKWVEGVYTDLASSSAADVVVGANRVRIVAHGPTIKVVSNGRTVLSFTDPDPITFGGVGFGSIWETNGSFDDVMVRALTAPESRH